MKKKLLLLVPLLFFIGCEDNDGDERDDQYDDYIDLQYLSWYDESRNRMVSYNIEGYQGSTLIIETCQWLRLYREYETCECLEINDNTIHVKYLDGINYEYVEM